MRTTEILLSLPKSLYVCLRLLPFSNAIKLPIMVRYNCKIVNLSGSVSFLHEKIKPGMLKIGFCRVGVIDKRYTRNMLEIRGKMILKGKAAFGNGSRISILKSGTLTVGNCFSNTAGLTVICGKEINIGNDVLISWDTLIMDTDFHETIDLKTKTVSAKSKSISIKDKVWIGTRSVILKGSVIPEGCIVGAMTLVNKQFEESNCLIAGNPAIIKKTGVSRIFNN